MDQNAPPSRPLLRPFLPATLVLVAMGSLGSVVGCSPQPVDGGNGFPAGGSGAVGGGFVGTGAGGGGATVGTGGGSSTGGGVATGGTGAGAVGNGGGTMSGGASATGGGAATGGASMQPPCEDKPYPYDPDWPDATCESWANEADACGESWFEGYCDISCGRCVPDGGIPDPPEEPCEDTPYPYDPDWPDATCESWANEADACGESWFEGYCDISCGRCVPDGGIPDPPEEPCEDTPYPYDPEWPDATCETWATEADACGETWFEGYCDVTCGRCVPDGGVPEKPMAPDCSGEGLPNVTGGEGHATRYWDCCQTHCSQFNGHRCGMDGTSGTGDQTSSCQGGGSFACYDEAPHAVSECLSYGHIAKANPNCGACYRIQFTGEGHHNVNDPGSKLIKGKQMIVKVTNTGSDVGGTQFDLMIPGGGVGQFNACSRQWNTNDLGAQYGGFLTDCTGTHEAKKECVRQKCMNIPAGAARDGCIWFVDWFQVADNPKFTSVETNCPF